MNFSKTLYALRKERRLSQEDLAGVIGVSRQAVQKWESGASSPDLDNLVALSRYFGVSLDELVKGGGSLSGREQAPGSPPQPALGRPAGRTFYEFKSRRTLLGLPLVHVHIGHGLCRAKGILAIGNLATGLVALGGCSLGVLSLGGAGLGLFSLAGLALGGVTLGGLSAGLLAFGGLAVGVVAVGGCSVGVYALGGAAFASRVAAGGFAMGPVAIGDELRGSLAQLWAGPGSALTAREIRQTILAHYPNTQNAIVELFTWLARG